MPLVQFFSAHPRERVKTPYFKRKLHSVLKREKKSTLGFNVILTDNRTLKALNSRFRKKPKPTDVLSFPFQEEAFLGEIYVSLDKARSQARDYRVSMREELWRLILHGTFHLLGYDHIQKKDRLLMEAKEAAYL